MRKKRTKEERERMRQRAEDHPRVRLLRALEAKGWADLEARGVERDRTQLRDA